MAEKDVWRVIRRNHPVTGARLIRQESKDRLGIVDVVSCYRGVSRYIELKYCSREYGKQHWMDFPYGLKGIQAVELHKWWQAGAPSHLIVGFGMEVSVLNVFNGDRVIDLFTNQKNFRTKDGPGPTPDLVLARDFSWQSIFDLRKV